jgi:hypothetical protein
MINPLTNISQRNAFDILAKSHPDGINFYHYDGHLLKPLIDTANFYDVTQRHVRIIVQNHPKEFDGGELITITGEKKAEFEQLINHRCEYAYRILEAWTPLGVVRLATLTSGEMAQRVCAQLLLWRQQQLKQIKSTFDEETLQLINAS